METPIKFTPTITITIDFIQALVEEDLKKKGYCLDEPFRLNLRTEADPDSGFYGPTTYSAVLKETELKIKNIG